MADNFDFLLVWQASAKIRLSDFLPPVLGVTVKQTITVCRRSINEHHRRRQEILTSAK
ncbi:MAG: hypothetical protein ABW099_00755 [Candidatus Binatia bacterium]|jgi:hypothetical protein